jgi:hypothetical protein
MKGKNESECRNYIRMHVRLKNGQTLVCGTHAFAPTCRLYEFSKEEEKFIDRLQIDGIVKFLLINFMIFIIEFQL